MAPDKPWKPPALGAPIWIEIPANNVAQSSRFYKAVFNWPFYGETQPAEYEKDKVMLFEFQDPRVSEGVVKVPENVNWGRVRASGRGGVCVWWLVEDVQQTSLVIQREGGRVTSDVLVEGKNGLYRYFEDPYGNFGVIYQFVGQVTVSEDE